MSAGSHGEAQQDTQLAAEQERLTAYFVGLHPDAEVRLSDFRKSTSGFSNETRFFTCEIQRGAETTRSDLVARWSPTGEGLQFQDYDVAFQYKAMKALAGTAVPVPKVLLLEEDPAKTGQPFFIMEKVEGKVTSDYPPGYHGHGHFFEASPAERAHMWWRSLEVMADLNRIDWRRPEFDFLDRPRDGVDSVKKRLDLMRSLIDWGSSTPIEPINRALTWLNANIPAVPAMALCWSDARPGNIIFQGNEPLVALDWEGLHIAPPEGDLAYFILVDEVAYRAHRQPRMDGLPNEEETIARYEKLTGRKVDSFDYYLLMQGTWLAIMMVLSVGAAIRKGITGLPEDYATNNVSIWRLEQLLQKTR